MVFQIFELDVTLTDYGLAVLSFILAFLLYQLKTKDKKFRWITILFFLSLACASFFGGTVHGFFPNIYSLGHIILWKLTLISIGMVALFSWLIAGNLILPRHKKTISYLASIEFFIYVIYVIFVNSEFKTAIYNYIPPTIVLLVTLIFVFIRQKDKFVGLGVIGLLLTFIAAWIQQAQIYLHPIYFNHNAFYHVVQAIALVLIFFTFRFIISRKKVNR